MYVHNSGHYPPTPKTQWALAAHWLDQEPLPSNRVSPLIHQHSCCTPKSKYKYGFARNSWVERGKTLSYTKKWLQDERKEADDTSKITKPDHWLSTRRAAVFLLLLAVQLLSGREGSVSDISRLVLRATARCGVLKRQHHEKTIWMNMKRLSWELTRCTCVACFSFKSSVLGFKQQGLSGLYLQMFIASQQLSLSLIRSCRMVMAMKDKSFSLPVVLGFVFTLFW